MSVCLGFFRFVARAALECVGFGVAGDFLSEVVPEMARRVFGSWRGQRPAEEVRADLQAIAALPDDEARRLAEQAISLEFATAPPDLQLSLADYLTRVPKTVRRTVRPGLVIGRPLDVIPLLPSRLSRFRSGQAAPGFPDWTLDVLLGEGGFGEVWKAKHAYLPAVALKYCLDSAAARFLRNEAELLGRIVRHGRHEGLVALLDTSLNTDPPCLKYEYVAGGDLAALIQAGPVAPSAARGMVRQLAGTLAHLHRLSPPIVHRDLKPANVLVRGGDGPRVAIADLGIGSVAGPATTEMAGPTALRGACTPLYASPQQMRGDEADPRDDVFALGVVWFQMLAGNVAERPAADWRDELAGADEATLDVLGKCLAARPERRWADAGALLAALDRLRRGEEEEDEEDELDGDLAGQVRKALARAQRAVARAARLADEGDFAGGVAVLERLPENLRDPALVESMRERRDRVEAARAGIRKDAKARRFDGLRDRIADFLALVPGDEEMRRLASAVPYRPGKEARNAAGMSFVLVPPGEFRMGSPESEAGRHPSEGPAHLVGIDKSFYLGIHPVTQEQFAAVMGGNPSRFREVHGQDARLFPAENVSWEDADAFCRALSAQPEERFRGRSYRLPTEAEWEHACRAGESRPFGFGASLGSSHANFDGRHPYGSCLKGTFLRRPCAVGQYAPNGFGLHDMHGQVWEWCQDWYEERYYRACPRRDPGGPGRGEAKVLRGGSWQNHARLCRAACRDSMPPAYRGPAVGFRVVMEVG